MNRTNYFDGQRVFADALTHSQDGLISGIKNRYADLFSQGVANGLSFLTYDSLGTITVTSGVGYDGHGERIYVPSNVYSIGYNGLSINMSSGQYEVIAQYGEINDGIYGLNPDGLSVIEHIYESYAVTVKKQGIDTIDPLKDVILGNVTVSVPYGSMSISTLDRQIAIPVNFTATVNSTVSLITQGFKNKLLNANFDVWQRGTSGSSAFPRSFIADRWNDQMIGSTTAISQQAFSLGQTDVPNEPTYFHRSIVTSSGGAGDFSLMYQPIEDVRTLAGKIVTISFYAKADAPRNIAFDMAQLFGTGGAPSSDVSGIGSVKFSLTTSWTKCTHTFTVPSISGKTIGSNNDSSLTFTIWFDAGSTYSGRTLSLGHQSGTFDIAQVQIEEGALATSFDLRHPQQELSLLQRYFEQINYNLRLAGASATQTSYCTLNLTFKVTKRTAAYSPYYSSTPGSSFSSRDNTFIFFNVAAGGDSTALPDAEYKYSDALQIDRSSFPGAGGKGTIWIDAEL